MISIEYAAGFFDGEGSVYAATRANKNNRYSLRAPTILVTITQVKRPVLEVLKKRWGGSIWTRATNGRQQECHQWVLCARMASSFLREIYPHLIVKKDVVGLAIEYCDLMALPAKERMDYSVLRPTGKLTKNGQVKMTRAGQMRPEIRQRAQEIQAAIRLLNARGAPGNATRKHNQNPNRASAP